MKRIIVLLIVCLFVFAGPLNAQQIRRPPRPSGTVEHTRDITRHQGRPRHYQPPGYSGGGNTVIIILNQERDEGDEIYRRNINR